MGKRGRRGRREGGREGEGGAKEEGGRGQLIAPRNVGRGGGGVSPSSPPLSPPTCHLPVLTVGDASAPTPTRLHLQTSSGSTGRGGTTQTPWRFSCGKPKRVQQLTPLRPPPPPRQALHAHGGLRILVPRWDCRDGQGKHHITTTLTVASPRHGPQSHTFGEIWIFLPPSFLLLSLLLFNACPCNSCRQRYDDRIKSLVSNIDEWTPEEVTKAFRDPTWTKAVIFRDPAERWVMSINRFKCGEGQWPCRARSMICMVHLGLRTRRGFEAELMVTTPPHPPLIPDCIKTAIGVSGQICVDRVIFVCRERLSWEHQCHTGEFGGGGKHGGRKSAKSQSPRLTPQSPIR